MPKNEKKPEWKSKTLLELTINGTVWRSQKVKSPDGKVFFGIRSFFTKKDGTETPTKNGFMIPVGECDHKTLLQINKLLKAIHTEAVEKNEKAV